MRPRVLPAAALLAGLLAVAIPGGPSLANPMQLVILRGLDKITAHVSTLCIGLCTSSDRLVRLGRERRGETAARTSISISTT